MRVSDSDKLLRICERFLDQRFPGTLSGRIGGGFSEAAVYRLDSAAGSFALKGIPHRDIEEARLSELHRFLAYLRASGIPVAVPIMSRAGTTYLLEDGSWWQLEPWLPGEPVEQGMISAEQLSALMPMLARMHLSAARYQTTAGGREWFAVRNDTCPAVLKRSDVIDSWSSARLSDGFRAASQLRPPLRDLFEEILKAFVVQATVLRNELEKLKALKVSLHPCWRDLWNRHVLFTGCAVTGLIDATAAQTDHVATDLSRLLGSLAGDQQPLWRLALEAYDSVRFLSPPEYDLVRILDRSGVLLSGMYWLAQLQQHGPAVLQALEVQKRIDGIAGRLKTTQYSS